MYFIITKWNIELLQIFIFELVQYTYLACKYKDLFINFYLLAFIWSNMSIQYRNFHRANTDIFRIGSIPVSPITARSESIRRFDNRKEKSREILHWLINKSIITWCFSYWPRSIWKTSRNNTIILHDYFPLKLIGKYLLLYNNTEYNERFNIILRTKTLHVFIYLIY